MNGIAEIGVLSGGMFVSFISTTIFAQSIGNML